MKHIILVFIFIGTVSAIYSQARMVNGNLSVGSLSTASEKLHVFGNARVNGNLEFDSANDRINWEESGVTKAFINYNGLDLQLINQEAQGWTVLDAVAAIKLQTGSTDRLAISSLGDVGIGVFPSSTGPKLQIEGDGPGDGIRVTRDGSSVMSEMWSDTNEGGIGTRSNHAFRIITNSAVRAQIDTEGEFGIGTTSPAERLHVNGAIRIGNTTKNANGTIRYTGSDVEARVGGSWESLTSGGASVWNTGGSNVFFNTGNVGVGTNNPMHNLEVNGNIGISGEIIGVSDIRTKTDINTIKNGLATVQKLNPVSYYFREKGFESLELPVSKQYGFIAQELESILPHAVSASTTIENDDGEQIELKGINYLKIVPFLTQAIQEQQVTIEALQSKVDQLQSLQDQIDEIKKHLK